MANWSDAILTDQGKALAAKVMAGEIDLQIREVWFGDGVPSAGNLSSKKIQAELIKKEQVGTDCIIRFRVRNNTVKAPILMRELGFYAEDSNGALILFSYMTDSEPATLPRYDGGKEYRQTMTTAFGYSNAEQVVLTGTILDGQTEEDVAKAIEIHNQDINAHEVLFKTAENDAAASDDSKKGASTSWVKNAFVKFKNFTSNQIKDFATAVKSLFNSSEFDDNVLRALRDKTLSTLGVKWSFSNPNSWYICLGVLFGGLIIQGIKITGITGSALNNNYSEGITNVTYPIAVNSLLGFSTGFSDTARTIAEHASVNASNNGARIFLHALGEINIELSTWLFVFGY